MSAPTTTLARNVYAASERQTGGTGVRSKVTGSGASQFLSRLRLPIPTRIGDEGEDGFWRHYQMIFWALRTSPTARECSSSPIQFQAGRELRLEDKTR
jgi:hypothetical protein